MTEEQIKQKAEAYAELLTAGNKEHYRTIYTAAKEGYIAGAHSRDEEIEELEQALAFTEDVVDAQKKELDKLRNPWRDAKSDPPDEDITVLILLKNQYWTRGFLRRKLWYAQRPQRNYYTRSGDVEYWMPIPENE